MRKIPNFDGIEGAQNNGHEIAKGCLRLDYKRLGMTSQQI